MKTLSLGSVVLSALSASAFADSPASRPGSVALDCIFGGTMVTNDSYYGDLTNFNFNCHGASNDSRIETFQYSGDQKDQLMKFFEETSVGDEVGIEYVPGNGMYNYPNMVLQIQRQGRTLSFDRQDWLMIVFN